MINVRVVVMRILTDMGIIDIDLRMRVEIGDGRMGREIGGVEVRVQMRRLR